MSSARYRPSQAQISVDNALAESDPAVIETRLKNDPYTVTRSGRAAHSSFTKYDDLMERARKLVDAMSPDARVHMYHAHRASFAYGNIALDWNDPTREQLDKLRADCITAAGPCPCNPCAEKAKIK